MSGKKVLLALLVLGGGGFLLWAATGGPTPAGPGPGTGPGPAPGAGPGPLPAPGSPRVFTHPSQCAECHPAVYEEWQVSMHSKAWTDPEVRALSEDFRSTECLSCHVPQPIHSAPVGGRVFERSSRLETGVDCLSCHLLPDGGVAAVRDVPGAPCRPTRVATLKEAVTCQGCHNQHSLVNEWNDLFRAPDPAKGALLAEGRPETCSDCHMKPVDRGGGRTGFDHVIPGGHYEEVLRSGMTLAARIEEGLVVAETTNSGVGHKAPADSRHRSFNVRVTVTTEGGVRVNDRTEIAEYRLYYRSPPRENTNLRPGETATARFPLPRGIRGKVLVELVYALNPVKKQRGEVKKVHEVTLDFDTAR